MPHQQAMADLFARHMDAELAGDLETTLATMTDNPHLVNVPSMVGGAGREGVRAFYADRDGRKFSVAIAVPSATARFYAQAAVRDLVRRRDSGSAERATGIEPA
jgi:carboxymethylenebutenolidase